ncbi:MAG: UDP-N-acetylmuramoyl-tripeptide--D-alanyl-D-alanine ligase [Eubacteriaceae bacterium]|nr:UDP-N-acetylmuramoyl-tripeptide--D-alanyl-D-alanine ligase [Eubacteriaceae bacterium]
MEAISIEILQDILSATIQQTSSTAGSITGIRIDSRQVTPGDLYIPIIGENNDGHRFIPDAVSNGASCVLTEQKNIQCPETVAILEVGSTYEALKALARYQRSRYTVDTIALTGSSGKTTTKDMIASVLQQGFKTLKTQGNLNNQYGIPLTLFNLNADIEKMVIEMGMDRMGDIEESIDAVLPDIAVITNIGTSHIEHLKTQENIYISKKEIFSRLTEKGIALINGDDPFLQKLKGEDPSYRVVTFSIKDSSADFYANILEVSETGSVFELSGVRYRVPIPGTHNVYDALPAIWLGQHFGLSHGEIQKGLDAFKPSENRMEIIEFDNGITLINDVYNANPDAMRAALETTAVYQPKYKRTIGVLGDMLEMGDLSETAHREIGQQAKKVLDILIAVGANRSHYQAGFEDDAHSHLCSDAPEAAELLMKFIRPGDLVLVKGSRGVYLETVIEKLKEGFNG